MAQYIHLSGRRWFQKTYGNTYHTTAIYIDGEHAHKTPRSYGYGEQWIQSGQEWLEKNGHLPDLIHHENGSTEGLRFYCERNGIKLQYECSDVERERDL